MTWMHQVYLLWSVWPAQKQRLHLSLRACGAPTWDVCPLSPKIMHIYIYTYVRTSISYTYMHTYTYLYTYTWDVCPFSPTFMYIYIYKYDIYMHIYIHTHDVYILLCPTHTCIHTPIYMHVYSICVYEFIACIYAAASFCARVRCADMRCWTWGLAPLHLYKHICTVYIYTIIYIHT